MLAAPTALHLLGEEDAHKLLHSGEDFLQKLLHREWFADVAVEARRQNALLISQYGLRCDGEDRRPS